MKFAILVAVNYIYHDKDLKPACKCSVQVVLPISAVKIVVVGLRVQPHV